MGGKRFSSFAIALLVALPALLLGCGPESPADVDLVEISAPDFAAPESRREWVAGTWSERGARREVWLRIPRRGATGRPWLEVALHDERGGPRVGRLLLGPDRAALHYHLASRQPGFPDGALLPNRLVALKSGAERRLGVLLQGGARDPAAEFASVTDLPVEEGARLVALGQVLGAWQVVAADRYPLDATGRATLPPFVPLAAGDWAGLRNHSLEAYLPASLGLRFVRAPGFRRLNYGYLARFSERLPELATAVERFAASGEAPIAEDELASLQAFLVESFEVYQGYLDSNWIEMVIRVRPPDRAQVSIYLHTVAGLTLESLYAEMPRRRLLREIDALSALRLTPSAGGAPVSAQVQQDRLVFPLAAAIEPRPSGATAFEAVRIEFELRGLARLGANFWTLLDQLRPRATNRATGKLVPDDHARAVVSLEDPRFGVGVEADIDDFLADLGRVLKRDGAEAGEPPLRVDRDRRRLVLVEGSYAVVEDLILPADWTLVVEAGADLRIHPGRSVLVRGALQVRGREERPVRVRGVPGAGAWGVLAVQGKGRSSIGAPHLRSEIRHLELSGGSEDQLKGVSYSGQLSVYNQDLVLAHATLSRSFADDSLNVKYGAVQISDSVFVDSFADGVDLDWSDGVIQRSFFGRSGAGGDGLDISGSRVVVESSVVSDVGDKCLSVGEASTLEIRGSLLRSCEVAIASKDGSLAEIRGSVFLDNRRNFAAYQKKPIFDGGRIRGEDLLLVEAALADECDAASEIRIEAALFSREDLAARIDVETLRNVSAFSGERFRELAAETP